MIEVGYIQLQTPEFDKVPQGMQQADTIGSAADANDYFCDRFLLGTNCK